MEMFLRRCHPELEKKKGMLMGMTENRHDLLYEFARGLAFHFKREASLVEKHLGEVAGNDPKMGKKVKDCMNSLRRYGLL